MPALRDKIIAIVQQYSTVPTSQGTVLKRQGKDVMIKYTLQNGSKYNNVKAQVPFYTGISSCLPKPGEIYSIGFNYGDPGSPFLIAKLDKEDSHIEEIDILSYEFPEVD